MPKNTDKLSASMGRRTSSSGGGGFSSTFAEKPVVETVRLAIDLDKDFHRRLKMLSVEQGTSQRDLVLNALRKAYPELRS